MAKFFRFPFAISGNKDTIPEPTDINGYVSYEQGYSLDYSRPIATDPLAKKIERTKQNQLFYDITLAIQQYQTNGAPDFITTADNGGVAYAYPIHAVCRYDDGGGVKIYRNTVAGNTNIPTGAGWIHETSLDALASLTLAADKLPYATSASAMALTTLTPFARSLLDDADSATARTTLGAQAADNTLTALAGVATAADKLPYFTGVDTASVTTLTAFIRTLLAAASAAAARTILDVYSKSEVDNKILIRGIGRVTSAGSLLLNSGIIASVTKLGTGSYRIYLSVSLPSIFNIQLTTDDGGYSVTSVAAFGSNFFDVASSISTGPIDNGFYVHISY